MPRIKRVMSAREQQVRIKLAERGMTQMELCERIGCPYKYLWLMLTGNRSGERYWDAICRELGLPCTNDLDKGRSAWMARRRSGAAGRWSRWPRPRG